jgi:hypothetical protein
LRSYEWDPSGYNVCGSFAEMLNNNYDSLDNRLINFGKKLKNVPSFYEAARQNIKDPTAEHTALAIQQNRGGVSVFKEELDAALKRSKLNETQKKEIAERARTAANAVEELATWLEKMPNSAPRSFRLGKELYDKKFAYDLQSGFSA